MSQITLTRFICFSFYFTLFSFSSCKKEEEPTVKTAPTVVTGELLNVTFNSAIATGEVTNEGSAVVTERGISWGVAPNPTTSNSKLSSGSGAGAYIVTLVGLLPNTTYYIRAYAINSEGTSYGMQQSFTTYNNAISSSPGAGVTYNGYAYGSVVLGNGQEWMTENLQTATYQNGDLIQSGLDDGAWLSATTGAYSIYNDDDANNLIYGKLYNWYAVSDPRNVCPTGWHVPTNNEWTTLTNYLGGESVAGGKMKDTIGWGGENIEATNESGFSFIPGGSRTESGFYSFVGFSGSLWSSTSSSTSNAFGLMLHYYSGTAYSENFGKQKGYSVRCLKD